MSDMNAYTVNIIHSVHMPGSNYLSIIATVNISKLYGLVYLRTISPK